MSINLKGVSKTILMFGFIFQKPRRRFINFFPLLKTEPFLCNFRGLKFLWNKIVFLIKKILIIVFLNLIRIDKNCSIGAGNLRPLRILWGSVDQTRASQMTVRKVRGHYRSERDTMGPYEHEYICLWARFCILNISAP